MDKLHWKSAADLAHLIRSKKVSAREVLEHFFARTDRYNPKLNAIVWQDRERARKRANTADAALWYVLAVRAHHAATGDEALVDDLLPTLRSIAALWPVTARNALREHLSRPGPRHVARFATVIGMRQVDFPPSPWDSFLNVNTPSDLEAARSRVADL